MLGALGQGSVREVGASKRRMMSLQGPDLTVLGLAWRKSMAVPRSLSVSRTLVGGLAFINAPNSAAAASTLGAPRERAMRFQEPKVLIASGKGLTTPLAGGFSTSRALPPVGDV